MKKTVKKPPAKAKGQVPDQGMTMEDDQPEIYFPTQADISAVMAELGRRGGKLGGKQRAANLTPEQRSEAAALAARSRWAKRPAVSNDEHPDTQA